MLNINTRIPSQFCDFTYQGDGTTPRYCLRYRIKRQVKSLWKGLHKLNPTDPLGILYDLAESRNSRWRNPEQDFNLNICL